MLTLILTGSIATGKTTVSNIMKNLGAIIVDTDLITHSIYQYPSSTALKIIEVFGSEYLDLYNNQIDRKKLSKLVFEDKDYLIKLNSIVHPDIRNEVKSITEKYKSIEIEKNISLLLVYVIPLYFEAGKNYQADYSVVSACSEENQINRLMKRNNFSYEEAKVRIDSQISILEKIDQADYVINTDQSFDKIENDVKKLLMNWKWTAYEEN